MKIARFARFHSRGRAAHFLKHSSLEVLILHLVPLKDDTAFEFPTSIRRRQFAILLDANLEDATDMHGLPGRPRIVRDLSPRPDPGNVPNALRF